MNLWLALLNAGARQEISADHLQAISSRLISTKHKCGCFDGLFDDRQLTLIKFEIDDLPRLGFLPRKMSFHLSFEFIPRELGGLVHPGCPNELEPISARHLDQFPCLGPAHHTELWFGYGC